MKVSCGSLRLDSPNSMVAPVFNFWEPLHYLDQGHGFQTWETSPAYGLRSWAYVLLHLLPAKVPVWFLSLEKVSAPCIISLCGY